MKMPVTKWDVLENRRKEAREALEKIEREMRGLELTPCTVSCGCGATFATEADFARHFYLRDIRYLNLGWCPILDRP